MSLQQQLDETSAALALLDTNNRGDLAEISRLTTLQNELTSQLALEERITVQETKVESIALPYDFNEVFGDPRANDIVIELIKDLQRQAYAEHNAEVELMITEHKAEVTELKSVAEDLNVIIKTMHTTEYQLRERISEFEANARELQDERNDALSKRDAAVAKAEGLEVLVAEKQEHIDKLRDEIAIGAKAAVNVLNISGNDRLASLVEASKQAKVKSALDIALENSAPFRGKVIKDGEVVAQLDAPQVNPFPVVDSSSDSGYQLVTGPAEIVPADDQVTPSEGTVQAVQSGLVESNAGENGQTLEEAFRLITALEFRVFDLEANRG